MIVACTRRVSSTSATSTGAPGSERVLHSFQVGTDGLGPSGQLLSLNGMLYGTTRGGGQTASGTGGRGTVYTIRPDGKETVIYRFMGGLDGDGPDAGLIAVDGTLYGTTARGGGNNCFGNLGCGTVFAISPEGAERVVYRFQGGDDGDDPIGLLGVNGILYGTTSSGGWSVLSGRRNRLWYAVRRQSRRY
jgi:uncharacterized repeat protein (TIGR03803 family)